MGTLDGEPNDYGISDAGGGFQSIVKVTTSSGVNVTTSQGSEWLTTQRMMRKFSA